MVSKKCSRWNTEGQGKDSVIEAPSGILFYDYTYNDTRICTGANCIIPTNKNPGNIQQDMTAFVPLIPNKSQIIELTL